MTLLELPFEPTHTRENSTLNEAHLNEHRDKFNRDCFNVLMEMVKGRRLTTKLAMNEGLSGHLPRRVKDLEDKFGMTISRDKMTGGFLEYYMTTEDKAKAMESILNRAKLKAA